jgi:O-antigen ligase
MNDQVVMSTPPRPAPVPDPPASGRRPTLRRIVDGGIIALLVLSPLPAASVPAWAVLGIELAVAVLAAAYALLEPKPRVNPEALRSLGRVRYAAAGFFAYLMLQVLPLPSGLVRILSPATYGFRRLYDPGFAGLKFMTLSLVPGRTIEQGLELLAYFLLGFLVIRTVTRGSGVRRIIAILAGCGVFQTLYGLSQLPAAAPRILFYSKAFSLSSVTGTFVNRSHLSGYLEMIVPLVIGLLIARMNLFSFGVKGARERFQLMMSQGIAGNLALAGAVVVMSLGIARSNSRAGLVVLGTVFFLFVGFSVLAYGRVAYRELWIRNLIRLTVLVILVMALAIGIGSTIQRFALDNLLHEDRPLYWANVADMLRAFPLFGTGLGTFAAVYPAYEARGGPELLLSHAHNDYLEFLSELGLVGAALLLGLVLWLAVRSFVVWKERRSPEAKGLALGGIVSLAGMAIHAVTDFNLHIPANLVLFTVVLGLTFVSAHHRKT